VGLHRVCEWLTLVPGTDQDSIASFAMVIDYPEATEWGQFNVSIKPSLVSFRGNANL
jgi:hypothetical protein